jgi:hypothetical protein
MMSWLAGFAMGREVLTRGARRFAALLPPVGELDVERPAEHAAPVLLQVTSGLHLGASMELTADEYVVGRVEECGIVLRDAWVAERHCRLIREGHGFSVQDLRAIPPQVIAPDRVGYEAGAITTHYDIGGVQFSLRQPPPPVHVSSPPYRWLARVPGAALPALVAVCLGLAIMTSAWTGHRAKSSPPHASVRAAGLGVLSDGGAARAVEQARQVLDDRNVQVEIRGGRLLVTGSTTQLALKGRIHALAADLHGTIPVEDHVTYIDARDRTNTPGPLPVTVRSVMIGTPSYFLTDSGERYFSGGVLPDGAEVLAIDATEIRFRRAGKVIVYKLEGSHE